MNIEQVIIQIEFIIIFFLSTETSGWEWPIQLIYIFIDLFHFWVTVILNAFYFGSHKHATALMTNRVAVLHFKF